MQKAISWGYYGPLCWWLGCHAPLLYIVGLSSKPYGGARQLVLDFELELFGFACTKFEAEGCFDSMALCSGLLFSALNLDTNQHSVT
jgi:hypothetical protein